MKKDSKNLKAGSKLSREQCNILFEKGTEKPFTGRYWNHKENGMYACANCDSILFSSKSKFDSGTGWPSFYEPEDKKAVEEKEDNGMLMKRTEVVCSKCGGHLGHLFNDGPNPTGLRYCINSASLNFKRFSRDKKE